MAKSLLNSYTSEEFSQIVKISNSWRDLARKLGYASNSSDLMNQLKARVQNENLDTSHFKTVNVNSIERNEENIFIENSTADQKTLRRWYIKGNYTEHKCAICGQEPFWQGKELTLILDHINGINNDDRLENLRWVCPNCNMQLPTTNRRKNTTTKKHYCIDCGKEISSRSTRCQSCAAKAQIIPTEELKVDRETLKDLIRSTPFIKIGAMFMVSDNTIRKWCDKFNLPRRASEIKQYSDEEWKNI